MRHKLNADKKDTAAEVKKKDLPLPLRKILITAHFDYLSSSLLD